MNYRRVFAACLIPILVIGCAKRVPVYDEAGKPISEREISRYQQNSNFVLFTAGGGVLSFGASFFIGTLIERAADNSNNDAALWATTAAGTVVGTFLFAHQGKKQDRKQAVEKIKDRRKALIAKELNQEKSRREKIQSQVQALKALKEKQEAERRRLLEEIEKRKKKGDNNY
ncbi:MAG: hypothetical protein ACE5HO_14495 [bacterium]